MKELALFGDSYAESGDDYKHTVMHRGWAKQLMIMFGDGMDNFAMPGSSLEFSVQNFLENHEQYKKIVFVTTWLHRLHVPIEFKIANSNQPSWTSNHWGSYDQCEHMEKYFVIESAEQRQTFKAIKDYFMYITTSVHAEKYALLRHRSLIDLVKKIRPDAIIIPAYNYYGLIDDYNWDLKAISEHEVSLFTKPQPAPIDLRHNHMTPASNKWVLEHVLGRLEGNFIELDLAKIPQFNSWDELVKSL
jgi:hypothetical protein